MRREDVTATASFGTPLLLSIGANLVWGVEAGSWVDIIAGVFTPLVLALAVERFYAVGHLDGWLRKVQVGGLSVVALVAASWSWVHTTALLLAHQPAPEWWMPWWLLPALCMSAPLAVDGLAVLSVLALGSVRAADEPAGEAVPTSSWGGPETVPATVPDEVSAHRAQRVTGQRTKRQLEARARELGVTRKADDTRDALAARVEATELALGIPAVPA